MFPTFFAIAMLVPAFSKYDRLMELNDQGRRISSTLKSLQLGDCGGDHEWDRNYRWENCASSLIELNELVGSMSGQICRSVWDNESVICAS